MARLFFSLLALAATSLGGCVSISEQSARQLDEVGDVELTTVICASETAAGPRCPASNSSELSSGGEYQVLVAYRLPAQTSPPESIFSSEPPVTLSRSTSYSDELERLAPPPPESGQRWAGYISPPFVYMTGDSQTQASLVARVMLLRSADGSPFTAPFRYQAIVGYRHAGEDPNRPVACGDTLDFPGPDASCLTYPSPEEMKADLTLHTRDLGILAGPSARTARGGTGAVPFTLAYEGATPSPSFALAATTTVPGGTAVPAVETAAPTQAGVSVVPVSISVPASTQPGSYEVALSATHGSGQTRRGTGLITVTGSGPVDRTPPELAVRMRTTPRLARARRIGVVADVSCSEPCTLTAQIRAGRVSARALGLRVPAGRRAVVVGSARETRAASGRRNVRVRFRRGLGPRMLRLRRLSLGVSVTARDRAGNSRRRSVTFSLRR